MRLTVWTLEKLSGIWRVRQQLASLGACFRDTGRDTNREGRSACANTEPRCNSSITKNYDRLTCCMNDKTHRGPWLSYKRIPRDDPVCQETLVCKLCSRNENKPPQLWALTVGRHLSWGGHHTPLSTSHHTHVCSAY